MTSASLNWMFSRPAKHRRRLHDNVPLACAGMLAFFLGCANPGPPRAPSLHLPALATHLTALRVADHVLLSWQVPANTVDGGALKVPITASICRDVIEGAGATPPCTEVKRLQVLPGSATAQDLLTPPLSSGSPTLLVYRIELFNTLGRTAGPSQPVYAASGAAPPSVGQITVSLRRHGLLLGWQTQAVDDHTVVEVHRKLLNSASPAGRVAPKGMAKAQAEVTVVSGIGRGKDPGGMIDRALEDGETVRYTAQRVRRIELLVPATVAPGKGGALKPVDSAPLTLELSSEPSPPVTFTFHDTIPPLPPTGLAAVPGNGLGEPLSIDLSWEANPESDVAGYNVYRAEAGKSAVKLNPNLVPAAAYSDLSAQRGIRYLYRVTAVDRRGNESAPSSGLPVQAGP